MMIDDFLAIPDLNPAHGPATDLEEEALGRIVQRCASANTALLWLYRAALISHDESEEALEKVDRLERRERYLEAEIRKLRGLPPEEYRDPLRAPQE
ncbi:hypothetical protein [Labrys sp. 22185]|uniref:hypothetical protein n=1 Tax=Labrys sp. 22185 TaxID=3453888 RepID=UPI003F84CEE8